MRAARTGWQAALRRAHADLAIGQRVIEDVELRDVALEVGVVLPVRAADVVLLARHLLRQVHRSTRLELPIPVDGRGAVSAMHEGDVHPLVGREGLARAGVGGVFGVAHSKRLILATLAAHLIHHLALKVDHNILLLCTVAKVNQTVPRGTAVFCAAHTGHDGEPPVAAEFPGGRGLDRLPVAIERNAVLQVDALSLRGTREADSTANAAPLRTVGAACAGRKGAFARGILRHPRE